MKIINNYILNKRTIAILLMLITILSNVSPVFAVYGSGTFVGGQFASYIFTNDSGSTADYGVLIRKLVNNSTGEQYTTFCAENGVNFSTGTIYAGEYYNPENANIKRACKIAYFGWYNKYGDYVVNGGISHEAKQDYVFTQQYIWETLGQSSARFINSNIQDDYISFKDSIDNQINSMQTRPSFDAETIKINAGETKILTDTNGVLANYSSIDNSKDNIRFQHNEGENTLTITVSENCEIENLSISDNVFRDWGLIKNSSQDNDTSIYFEFSNRVQNQLYSMHYNDPVSLALNLEVESYGKLELTKLDTHDNLIDGSIFNITGPNDYNNDVTVTNGRIVVENLKKGTYYIKEKSAPDGYIINTLIYEVEINPNQITKQTVSNSEPIGKIILYKISENNDKIGGAVFKITAAEKITNRAGSKTFYTEGQEVATITTESETGIAQIDNLPLGKYNIKEIKAPKGYLLNEKTYTADLVYKNDTTPVVELKIEGIKDLEPTGKIVLYKVSENNDKIGGAVFKITAAEKITNRAGSKTFYTKGQEVATITTESETGIAQIDNLPLGKYNIKEIKAPKGYLLNEKTYTADLVYKNDTTPVVELSIEGIKDLEPTGKIVLYKVSENNDKIGGAVFKITAAEKITNRAGSKTFYNEGQEVETITTEPETGIAQIDNLPLGKYNIKEIKAPKGYLLNEKTYTADLLYKNDTTPVVELRIEGIKDLEPTGKIVLYKVNENNDKIGGAVFRVTAAEKITNKAGSKIFYNKGQEVAIITTAFRTGIAQIDNLPLGKYNVKEISAPNGYLINKNTYTANLEYKNDTTSVVELRIEGIKNLEPTGKIVLYKVNENNDKIGGAVFKITAAEKITNKAGSKTFYTEGQEVATITTASGTGIAQISKLPLGKYNIKEIKAPKGYLLNDNTYTANLVYKNQTTPVIEFKIEGIKNTEPTGKIVLYKVSENNDKIGGAVFKITAAEKITNKVGSKTFYTEGQEVATITTASGTGIAQIDNLPLGKYNIKEIKASEGYLLNENTYTANLVYKNDTTPVIEFKIEGIKNTEPTGKIVLYKVSENNDKIGGAVFKITAAEKITNKVGSKTFYTEGQEVATITTASGTGIAQIDNLPLGKYNIKEIKAPQGYLLNDNTYTANLIYKNQTTPVIEFKIEGIKNTEPTGKIVLYKISENNDKIGGAVFRVTAAEKITNKAGSKTFYNEGQEVATITTASGTGIAQIDNLPLGKYYVKEISAPEGYLLNQNTYTANLVYKDQNTPVVELKVEGVKDTEPTGKIILYKVSENNDKIGGAVFKVTATEKITNKAGSKTFYTKGQEVATITTASGTGIAQIDNLPLGKYNVKEIQAPTGYLLNENTYTANLVYKNDTTPVIEIQIKGVVDEEPRGTISIIKKDSKTGSIAQGDATLKNAVYKVYANEDIYNVAKSKKWYSKGDLVATRNTDEKGVCQDVTELPLGKYIVKEETPPIGYLIDKKEYEVNLKYKDQYTKIITGNANSTDKVKEMRVHIFKSGIDVNSGKTPGLAGAVFTIKLNSAVQRAYDKGYTYEEVWEGIDEFGNTVTVDSKRVAEAQVIAPTYESIETDENGDAYTQKVLPYGTFIVKETRTPKDYESAADFKFSITNDESEIQDVAKKVKDLVVNNEQLETYIKLIKKDKTSGKTVSLNNATFQIKATKDIYDRATNKILYKKGEVITQKIGSTTYNSFTTNAKNMVVPANSYNNKEGDPIGSVITPLKLEVGTYEITEIRIPEGFLKLENPVSFKVEGIRDYDKDQDGDFIKEVIVKNEQPTGTLIVDKSIALREDADTSLVDVSDLSGIQFKLTAKEDIIDYSDGSIIYKKGQEVKTYNLDKNGDLKVEKLPMGKYELQEVKVIDGLVLNDTIYDVEFIKQDDVTKVYTVTKDIVNDTTMVEFSKVDITGEKELEGAKLTVLDKEGNVVDSWTSTSKTHKIEGLVAGKSYILREEIAPNGFVRATDIEFKVENTKEIQKVTMVDKVVDMTKKNITGDEIEGAKMQVFDKEGKLVDEWTSSKEAHKISNLVEGEKYTLHEEIAPDGYVKATDIEFEVTLDKETQHEEMIDKVVDMTKKNIAGDEVEGAKMQVLDKEGNIIDEWVSGKEPHIIRNLKENETYTLHEETAPEGYVVATDIEFTVTLDKEIQHEVMIDKVVKMSKVDVGGDEVEGAKIQVFDKDNNIVDEWVSGKEPHIIKNLVEGEKYTLHEEIAPDGYVKATDIEFEVTMEKENQKIVMIDKIVDVTKTDLTNGKELEGAELVVTDEEGNVIDKWISSKEPHHITGLEEGKKYTLTEITAPYGYEITESIEFEVSLDKENQLVEMKDMPILKSVRVEKLDKDTKEHIKSNKFVFGIYEDEACTQLIKEAGANEYEGTALFDELRYGTYYIKEIKAPLGYKLSDQVVKVEINDKGVFADGVSLEEKDDVYSFEYYNSLLPRIQTGNETNYFLLGSLAVISLIGVVSGIILLRKKHNEK